MMKLGDRVKDNITGFKGILIAETHWLHGCVRHTIASEKIDKDGDAVEMTFDEGRVELVKPKANKPRVVASSGGPRRNDPQRC